MNTFVGDKFRVIPHHYLIASSHPRSLSHQLTYSRESRFRRCVIAKLYQVARDELRLSQKPMLSEASKLLFFDRQTSDIHRHVEGQQFEITGISSRTLEKEQTSFDLLFHTMKKLISVPRRSYRPVKAMIESTFCES